MPGSFSLREAVRGGDAARQALLATAAICPIMQTSSHVMVTSAADCRLRTDGGVAPVSSTVRPSTGHARCAGTPRGGPRLATWSSGQCRAVTTARKPRGTHLPSGRGRNGTTASWRTAQRSIVAARLTASTASSTSSTRKPVRASSISSGIDPRRRRLPGSRRPWPRRR